MRTPLHDAAQRQPLLAPEPKQCICPGKEVPFYCPVHGAVENPEWPLLKPLAGVLEAVKDEAARRMAAASSEETTMATVFIEARPKGRPDGSAIEDYVVEDHADHVLETFKTQHEAIAWARKNGHSPHVARVRHLNDKKVPDHWRPA